MLHIQISFVYLYRNNEGIIPNKLLKLTKMNTLEEQLRKEFTGKISEGYRAYTLVEVRIKDHSCNAKNNIGRVVSIVCNSDDATSSKFLSDNINVSGNTFEEACLIIKNNLFEAAKEEISESFDDYDKANTIIDLHNNDIISDEQGKVLFELAEIEDEDEIYNIERNTTILD